MSKTPTNDIWKMQHRKLPGATFKKGVVSSINVTAFSADVYFTENPNNIIRSVPLASHIDPTKILVGYRCRIDIFDETNIASMCVAYIIGRRMA